MIEYNKLIRDKIPSIIEASGKKYSMLILDDQEYQQALDQKLQEELDEYLADGSVEELADLVEVIYGILDYKKVSLASFEKIRTDKTMRRGAFKRRLYLESVEEESE